MVRRARPHRSPLQGSGAGRLLTPEAASLTGPLHPDLTPARRQELLREGVALYQQGRYFDCHEAFEEVWRSTTPEPKDLIQGLIQIAVGVYHYRRGKPEVAARVLAKGRRRVEPYPSPTLGLDLQRLLDDVRRWEAALQSGSEPGNPPELRIVEPNDLA